MSRRAPIDTFDTIVVGGGIAGLLTALRLGRSGQNVALIEADRLGSGATCSNHGMLHSGALYVRQHSHVVLHCQDAQRAFTALLAHAELPVCESVYVIPTPDRTDFLLRLDEHQISYRQTDPNDVPELCPTIADTHALVVIRERVVSSRRIVAILAAQCLGVGIAILTGNTVRRVAVASGRVAGVVLGTAEHLVSNHVVIASGTGTQELLAGLGSRQLPLIKSRLATMIYFPSARLRRGLILAALDNPIVMPAPCGGALASFYGGVQPQIAGRRSFPVDLEQATMLLRETAHIFTPNSFDYGGAVAYAAAKTDYVGSMHTENGVVNPGYHVIDHRSVDGLRGLHTVITGKMTLGFHASKAVADAILGTDLPLVIEPAAAPNIAAGLLAVEPWAPPEQI